jgi:hypothetical protein
MAVDLADPQGQQRSVTRAAGRVELRQLHGCGHRSGPADGVSTTAASPPGAINRGSSAAFFRANTATA